MRDRLIRVAVVALIVGSFAVIVVLKTIIAMSHVSHLQNSGAPLLVQICFAIFGLFLGRGITLRYYRPSPDRAKHGKSNGSSLQPSSSGHPKELSFTQLLVRVLIAALLVAVVLTAFNALLPSHIGPKPFSLENVRIQVASSILYIAIMAPLARQVSDPFSRFLVIFIPMYKRLNGPAIQ